VIIENSQSPHKILNLCSCSTELKHVALFERNHNMPWSIEQLFRRNIETKLSQNVANGIHDKKGRPLCAILEDS
jgi:hypothetical protein